MSRTRVIVLAVWTFVWVLFVGVVMSDQPVGIAVIGAALWVVIAVSIVWAINRARRRIDGD